MGLVGGVDGHKGGVGCERMGGGTVGLVKYWSSKGGEWLSMGVHSVSGEPKVGSGCCVIRLVGGKKSAGCRAIAISLLQESLERQTSSHTAAWGNEHHLQARLQLFHLVLQPLLVAQPLKLSFPVSSTV